MKFKKLLAFSLATICMVFGLLAGSVRAEDYYIEKHTDTFMDGKPTGTGSLLKLWIKKDKIRYFNENDKDHALIVHMDQDKAYRIDKKKKTVQEVDLKGKFAAMVKEGKVSSKKTNKTKKIDQWQTYQVLLNTSTGGMPTEVEYWLSDAVKVPIEIRKKMAVYFGQEKVIKELSQYPGYPVQIAIHMNIHGKKIDIVTKLVKLETKEVDKHLFEIPAKYKKEALPTKEAPKTSPQPKGKKNKATH